jgi:lysylphosphatidylglycerol synthetase-like protein (DUF2156 family)
MNAPSGHPYQSSTRGTGQPTNPVGSGNLDDYWMERHKFVLEQIQISNEAPYKILTAFQTLETVVATAVVALMVSHRKWQLDLNAAHVSLLWLSLLFTGIAVVSLALVVVNVANWTHYRREECRVVRQMTGNDLREPPRFRNFYRWSETYIIVLIVLIVVLFWVGIATIVYPQIQ